MPVAVKGSRTMTSARYLRSNACLRSKDWRRASNCVRQGKAGDQRWRTSDESGRARKAGGMVEVSQD
ncbi:hypothetical protein VTL71DRAFT_15248 [Oculimacula yallundae]|uniref:Uncharacterized protein n=1 Tax=Oculimacula yallundae TaxID=86028 RepID=A0ABR4CG17_9HELO